MKGTKNRIQSFIDTYNSLMEKCEIIVDYANTLENLPPQGEGARAAVEEELNTLFGRMHKQLNKLQKHLIDKVWEVEE